MGKKHQLKKRLTNQAREDLCSKDEDGVFPDPPKGWAVDCLGGIGGERARRILRKAGLNVRGFFRDGYTVPPEQGDRALRILERHGY